MATALATISDEALARLKDALVTYAERKGSAGVREISDEFDALFARLTADTGAGKELLNSSVNGKTFGWQVTTTVEQRLAVFGEALREINGDRIVATSPDFRSLQR